MQMFYTLSFQLSFIVISAITTWRNRVTGKSTIMVVDDEPDLLNLTKKFLESEGYQVHAFSDPEAAIQHVRQGCTTCTIVVSDIRMPGMSGFELVRQLKEILPKTRVVLMSSFVIHKEEFKKVMPSFDVDEFVMKPFTKAELVDAVKNVARQTAA
jgi:CheY-like chemotaxis protein